MLLTFWRPPCPGLPLLVIDKAARPAESKTSQKDSTREHLPVTNLHRPCETVSIRALTQNSINPQLTTRASFCLDSPPAKDNHRTAPAIISPHRMTTSNFLTLEPATLEDIPSLTELWYEAFTEPATRHIWPDTPGVRQWWNEATRCDMLNKPCALYVKIVDPQAPDAHGRPRIVAFAKWDLAMPKERGRRWPPWHADQPGRECEAFLETLERNRRRVMGESKHYCMSLVC